MVTAKADTTGASSGPEGPAGGILAGGVYSKESSLRERFCWVTEVSIGAVQGDVKDEVGLDVVERS